MHYLPDYKQELNQYLSENLEVEVKFDSISSQWEGFDPVLSIHGLTVGNQQLLVGKTSLNFSFIQSLLNLQPKFDRILLEKTVVSLTQSQDGHWTFLDFDTEALNSNDKSNNQSNATVSKLLSFFNGITINVKELDMSIFNDKGKVRTLRAPTLNVNYENEQLYASGQLLESQGDKTLLNFSLNGSGFLTTQQLKGTIFVEARSSEFFGELLSVYDWKKITIQDVEASGRAWLSFEGFKVNSIYGDLQVREINWSAKENPLPSINNLALAYFWQVDGSERSLSIENFAFEWADFDCAPLNAKMSFLEYGLNVQADKVDIECMTQLMLSLGILPEQLGQRLSSSKPTGYLSNIYFRLFNELEPNLLNNDVKLPLAEIEQERASSFEFEAMLVDVDISAYESTPSAKNINGYAFATNNSGFVSFLSDDFELGFPTLYLDPFLLSRAEGKVFWDLNESGAVISSDGLRLWRDGDSLIYGDFILRLNDQQDEDYLSLALGMQDILFPEAVDFVPYHIVGEGLYNWLDASLVAGNISSGIFYGYGSVESEKADNSFTSSIYLKSNQGVLGFDKEWPYLEDLNADILVQNTEVWIDSPSASIAGTQLNKVKAYLPKDKPKTANFIDISANSTLDKKLVNYWLTESPISNHTTQIAQQLEINTGAKVNIDIKVPVSQNEDSENVEDVAYKVITHISDGAITHIPSNLKFEAVTGNVVVDSKVGVTAKSIKADLFEESVTLAIKTDYRSREADGQLLKDRITKLLLKGNLGLENTFKYFDSSKPDFINGKFAYLAELTLSSDAKKYPLLTIDTNLVGVDCNCPIPFDKKPLDEQRVQLSLLLKPEQSYLEASVISPKAPRVNAELLFVDDKLTFGEFRIGGAKVKNTDIKGINIAAQLDAAELGEWIDFLQQSFKTKPVNESIHNTQNIESPSSQSNLITQIQLDINKLNAFDYLFQKSSLYVLPTKDSWKIIVDGEDAVGSVLLSDSKGKLILEFEKLNLSESVSTTNLKPSYPKEQETKTDPRTFPLLSFKAKNLLLDGRSIGRWQFDLTPDDTGSLFRNIKGYIKGNDIGGQVNWRYNAGIQNTIATLTVKGKDISEMFNAFDLPVLMSSSRYNADMAFVWPDSPSDFSLAQLSGNINLSLEEGFLKTEDQKTSVLRLFGVLNAESIKRRLKLDFSDLYKSGVGFDTFDAKASMDQGLLTLTEPLIIDGPAGKYTLNGRSDLSTKALDLDMLVELPFSQNVPLAALVLGAPQIGGLVWVADKLLGEPLSALTTSRYDIGGTWDEPRVDLKQAMNASKKDRTKEKGTRDVGKPSK